jgi:hypothetical protein
MASKGGVIVVVSGEDKTGEVFNAVKKHLDETRDKAKETSDSLGDIGKLLQSGLQTAGIAIGLREIVGGFKEMVTSTMEAGVQIGHLSQQTGISVQNLSILKYAAQSTGVDFEVLTRGFKKLAVTTYEADNGNKKAAAGFNQLGISVAQLRAKGDDMYGVLSLVADKFHEMPDGIVKSDTAAKIFGARMGSELIPVLDSLGGKLEEQKAEAESLGLVWDKAGIAKMEEMHKAVTGMKGAFAGLALEITSSLAPALTKLAEDASGFIQMMRLSPGQTMKGMYGAELQQMFGSAGPGLDIELDAAAKLVELQKAAHSAPSDAGVKKAGTVPKGEGGSGGGSGSADRTVAAQRTLDDSLRQLADAGAKLDETRARVHAQTMISILDEMHKQGLVSEADYLTQKETYQNAAFDAERTKLMSERRALTDQMNTLASGEAKTGKDRIETESKLNALQAKNLEIEGRLVELDAKRATFARQIADAYAAEMAKPIDTSGIDQGGLPTGIFGSQHPNVKLAKWTTDDAAEAKGEAEKFAHGIFDPLFNLGEKWTDQWKQIKANMLRDLGQAMEGQLFGALFGDSSGSGGKGLDGSRGGHHGISGAGGLVGSGLSAIEGLFGKKAGPTSNGTGAAGAGTVSSAAAALAQMGKGGGAGGAGGIQVILNNNGSAMQVDQTQQSSGDGGEGQVIQIFLKQLETNGPVSQGIMGLFNR